MVNSNKKKISKTFIDFAQPFISIVDKNTTEYQIKRGFEIAYTVWNAVVMDAVNRTDHYTTLLNQLTSDDPLASGLLKQMVVRKQMVFAEDLRLIGEYKVTYKNGNLHVWAEARAAKPS